MEGCFLLLGPFRHSLAGRVLSVHYASSHSRCYEGRDWF